MKQKSIISAIAYMALATCLMCVCAPSAFAASGTGLAAGTPALEAQATASNATPKLKAVKKVQLKSEAMGEITASWTEPVIDGKNLMEYKYTETPSGLKFKSYTVRYSYKKSMKGAKTKTCSTNWTYINKVKKGKRVYVQVRANATYGNKTVHSKWSKVKSVKVDTKHKYTYTLLKERKLFNSFDEMWAYCEKQPEVYAFAQNYVQIVEV